MIKYNIEFGHVYSDGKFQEKQKESLNILFKEIEEKELKIFTTCLLVDDYNVSRISLDLPSYLKQIKQDGIIPDIVFFESKLILFFSEFISLLPKKEASYLENYFERKGKHACSTLTAIWYLIRLGIIKSEFSVLMGTTHLINILPKEFKAIEQNTIKLLSLISGNERIADNIEYHFF